MKKFEKNEKPKSRKKRRKPQKKRYNILTYKNCKFKTVILNEEKRDNYNGTLYSTTTWSHVPRILQAFNYCSELKFFYTGTR